MATKPLTQGPSDKKNFLKSAAPLGVAAGVGAVAGACISSAQTDPEPKPEPEPKIDTPLTQETPESNPVYTGPTYQHDPEADSEEQPSNQNAEPNVENPNSQNANANSENQNNTSNNTPSENVSSEEEAAMKEIAHDQIDSEDLDEEDAFQVIGFETRTTTEGEEIEVVKVVDVNGNELIMVDTDGNGIYDSVFTMDNEYVGELARETLTKADMLEKMNPIGYIKPIPEDIPIEVPTGEDIVITDAKDDELEDIVNHMINNNEQNLMAYTDTEVNGSSNASNDNGGDAEEADSIDEEEILAMLDDEVDYDDTVNEEEILAMLDDEIDDEEDDEEEGDEEDDEALDDGTDFDELDA